MNKSTIIEVVRRLDKKEIRELGDFIRSPFHNKSKNAIKLFEYLEALYPSFDEDRLRKKDVFNAITGKEKYNDGLMRIILHSFSNLLDEYLVQVNLRAKPIQKGIYLLDELNARKFEKLFSKTLKSIQKEQEKLKYKNSEYYKSSFETGIAENYFGSWKRYRSKDLKDHSEQLGINVVDNFICYYLTVCLSYYRFQLFRLQTDRLKVNLKMLDEVLSFLGGEGAGYLSIPVIRLHYYEIMLFKDGSVKYFRELKKMLVDDKELIHHDLRYSTHNILQQYCVNKMYSGEPDFGNERLELYKIAMQQNLFSRTYAEHFDEIIFMNIFKTAVSRSDHLWAEEFFQKHKGLLPPSNRPFITDYCEAMLLYAKGKYNDALDIASRCMNVKHWQYKLLTRDLVLMIYYELGWLNEALAQIDAYRHYMETIKTKISNAKYERTLKFIKAFGKLVKIKEYNDRDKARSTQVELNKTSNVNEKAWLVSKLEELLSS